MAPGAPPDISAKQKQIASHTHTHVILSVVTIRLLFPPSACFSPPSLLVFPHGCLVQCSPIVCRDAILIYADVIVSRTLQPRIIATQTHNRARLFRTYPSLVC